MSSMPDRDAPGQPGGSGWPQAGEPAGEPGSQQAGWGSPQEAGGTRPDAQGGLPDAGAGLPDAGGIHQDQCGTPQEARGSQQAVWGGQPGPVTAVGEAETRVTWRRIFQYWIDAFFVSVIPYLVSIPFDRSRSTIMHFVGGVVYVVLFALIGLWYWVIRPHSHNGQTFAMKWFGLRVISKHGGPATMTQLFVRWISLLLDSAPWMWPFTGLLGLIVMLCSRYRQRIGDHLARTLVIRPAMRSYGGEGGPGEYGLSGAAQPETGAGQEVGAGQVGAGPHGRRDPQLPGLQVLPGRGSPARARAKRRPSVTARPAGWRPRVGPALPAGNA